MHRLRINKARGFTLIELIVVVLIIGILAAIAIIGYGAITENARAKAFEADVKQVVTAISAEKTAGTLDATSAGKILSDANLDDEDGADWDLDFPNETIDLSGDTRAGAGAPTAIDFSGDIAVAN